MAYEIQTVDDDAVTISNFGVPMMRIITEEVAPGQFVQKAVMRKDQARAIVQALDLAEMVKRVAERGMF